MILYYSDNTMKLKKDQQIAANQSYAIKIKA